jgi:predicted nucleotidyltransferase
MSIHTDVPTKLPIPMERIEAFCRKWGIAEFALFGSVLRDDFGPDSDVDVLVRYRPDAMASLLDELDRREELEEIFGRPVDLVTTRAVERSRNPVRKREILGSARVVYAES